MSNLLLSYQTRDPVVYYTWLYMRGTTARFAREDLYRSLAREARSSPPYILTPFAQKKGGKKESRREGVRTQNVRAVILSASRNMHGVPFSPSVTRGLRVAV